MLLVPTEKQQKRYVFSFKKKKKSKITLKAMTKVSPHAICSVLMEMYTRFEIPLGLHAIHPSLRTSNH